MPAIFRLAWRQQRFELTVLIGACLVLAVMSVVVAWQLKATEADLVACYRTAPDSAVPSWACQGISEWGNRLMTISAILIGVATAAPFLVGLFLGTPVVAREIERRTAPIAWSLSPSRRAWLAGRVLPLALVLGLALLIVGQASEALILATPPGEIGFGHFAMHGPLIAVRGLAVFGIGVVVGLVVGRVLPAILATGLLVAMVFIGLQLARDQLMRAEAVWIDVQETGGSGSMIYDSAFTDDTTGELITFDEAYNRYPEVFGPQGSGMPPGMSMVYLATPPEQYPLFVVREIAALAGVGIVATVLAMQLVAWRRPE